MLAYVLPEPQAPERMMAWLYPVSPWTLMASEATRWKASAPGPRAASRVELRVIGLPGSLYGLMERRMGPTFV